MALARYDLAATDPQTAEREAANILKTLRPSRFGLTTTGGSRGEVDDVK